MQYAVKDGQNIFDIALNTIGSIENMYAFISSNPQVSSIDFDFIANTNQVLTYTAPLPSTPAILTATQVIVNKTASIQGRDGQSLYDIVLMTTGSIDTMYADILIPNNISEANKQSIAGVSFSFDKTKIKDVLVYNYFQNKATVINTGLLSSTDNGYLLTENNFILNTESGNRILANG